MRSKEARVMVSVSGHWLVGVMPSTGTRIQDALNDGGTEFVRLIDVRVCQHAERESRATILSEALVPKSKVEIVVVPGSEHEAPAKRLDNLAVRATVSVFAIASKYRLQGELHLPTSCNDSVSTLNHRLGRFFPITRASVSGADVKQMSVPLLFANKDFVSCFHVGEPAGVESASVETAAMSPQSGESDLQENLVEVVESFRGLLREADLVAEVKVNSPAG